MELIPILPHFHAVLNLASAILLFGGFLAIRRRDVATHRKRMAAALSVSVVFLISYLTYHAAVGNVKFAGEGWIRPVYFTLLISHVGLAALSLPLIFFTLRRAPWLLVSTTCEPHRRIARLTWPVWMFVSISGLVVYLMAFHLYPPTAGG
ncbi:MAG: DUF420 domain-containing protein [Magnetococcales bacterium]|nr:DUF420 domain-containing protein [Magnetococcales bacterium]